MNDEGAEPAAAASVPSETAGTTMRRAREARGMSIEDVAAKTRVPQRHLEAIERGDYGALPGLTYCAGFARAYARAVNLDEAELVARVRAEVDAGGEFASAYVMEEPADPARVPPRMLAWIAALIAVLIIGGYAVWRMQINTVPADQMVADAVNEQGAVPAAPVRPAGTVAPPALPQGPVVLTAADDVWLRIYDAKGMELYERIMKRGESFAVPADADNPMILTGRPDALAVTVGGRPVPPLGTAERTISDVPISAAALLARPPELSAQGEAATPAGGADPGNAAAMTR